MISIKKIVCSIDFSEPPYETLAAFVITDFIKVRIYAFFDHGSLKFRR